MDETGGKDSTPNCYQALPLRQISEEIKQANCLNTVTNEDLTDESVFHAVSIPRLAKLYEILPSLLYERSRKSDLPGMRRIGKRLIRVNLQEFDEWVRREAAHE